MIERREHGISRFFSKSLPESCVGAGKSLGGESATESGGATDRGERGLDHERPRAAHRIEEWSLSTPSGKPQQAGREPFRERTLHLDRPIAAAIETLTREVSEEKCTGAADENSNRHIGVLPIDVRSRTGTLADPIDESIFDPESGETSVVELRSRQPSLDRERPSAPDQILPPGSL